MTKQPEQLNLSASGSLADSFVFSDALLLGSPVPPWSQRPDSRSTASEVGVF